MHRHGLLVALLALLAATACVGGPPNDGTPLDPALDTTSEALRGCGARWAPSAEALAVGASQHVPYEGAGRACSDGASPGALELGRFIRAHFAGRVNRSVPGDGVQIFNCRRVRSGRALSLHATGRALDVFIPKVGGRANNAAGDVIANWLVANAGAIGVQFLIWDRTQWKTSGTHRARCYGGSHPHDDHIHVELSRAGAARRTAFFQEEEGRGPAAAEPDAAPAAPEAPAEPVAPAGRVDSDEPEGPAEPVEDRAPPAEAWIGDPCAGDEDCRLADGRGGGTCLLSHRPATGVGVCSLPCAGYCPDRSGAATTFCAPHEALGLAGRGGACVSKAHAVNQRCARRVDLMPLEVERHVGPSGAPPAWATVCAPVEALPSEDAAPPAMCGGAGVAMGEHGDDCAGTPQNTWRCACSARWNDPISQVCRGGEWITYHRDPADCAGCAGAYGRACE